MSCKLEFNCALEKSLKVQTAILPVNSFFMSRWKSRVEEERDRVLLPIPCVVLVLPHPCFWSKQQRKTGSKALLYIFFVFLLEMGSNKTPFLSSLQNFLAAHDYLKVNHNAAGHPLKQSQNEKACM